MSNNSATNLAGLTPRECFRLLVEHRHKWLLPSVVCGVLALGYALTMSRYWEASQGLMVRPEVSASENNEPGKFADLYQMRTFQETILELAKSQQVIAATLKAVDARSTEPSAKEIKKLRKHLSLLPPGGAEFGKTEVCYLQVKDTNRERALQLVAEFSRQIDQRLHRLRTEQAKSLSNELKQQVKLAQAALATETTRLAGFEAKVGADLGELRMLNASYSGQSDLRQQAVNLQNEQRAAELEVRNAEQLLVVLRAAQQQPEQLIAMPNSLLVSQPTLRRLKDGLVDAQLRAARLGGTRTTNHPQVLAAKGAVQTIRNDLHDELSVAIRGVDVELGLNRSRMAQLEREQQGVQQRLGQLAELRAGYANRTSAVDNSRLVLGQAQKQLGKVSATLVAAQSARLVTPIDQPETGPNPGGPGRASVVLLGTFGGFALGMGWLFLTVVPAPTSDENLVASAAVEPVPEPATETVVEPVAAKPAAFVAPIRPNALSTLPPAVAAKIAEIVASRKPEVPIETCV
ncbi:MAG: hypothetical protein GXP24_03925 [Planctomycetes bacterium]|nr:hypothetical protein [Planctomycetota bacterium]